MWLEGIPFGLELLALLVWLLALLLALRRPPLTRLSLGVYSHNQRAIALYERHGFVREGLSRGLAFGHGRYLDSIEMARLHPRLERTLAEQRAE